MRLCFTEPELAQVGYTEAQAKEEGLDYKASKFPYLGNGRALSLDDTTGFVKLITLKEDDTVIGAQIAGNGASDIISELGLAIEAGMNLEDIALTVHAHPTLGEMSMEVLKSNWNANPHNVILVKLTNYIDRITLIRFD